MKIRPLYDRILVKRLEPQLEGAMTFGYYQSPTADDAEGRYRYNGSNLRERSLLMSGALISHELVPGHHFQINLQFENESLPAFRKDSLGYTAFVEGWGLYVERLAAEMDLYRADLDRFGILSFDAWRACRLVVDTGMHALGWSRDRAIAFMVEHTALARNNVVNEVDRYIAMPGQALAYKLGQLELLRLRDEAKEALGARFDIRVFHDTVLGEGAVGLATLRAIVADWLAGRSPA